MPKTKIERSLKFSKKQILDSEKYKNNKDLLNAVLKDSVFYSLEEIDKIIEKFMKGKVK